MSPAGLVLAAGASRRLGRTKQLLPLGGKPLLSWPLHALQAVGAKPCVVVLGHDAEAITTALDLRDVHVVVNARYALGMSTSLRAGLEVLPDDVDSTFLLTGDQPFVPPAHLQAMFDAAQASGRQIIATDYGDFLGVPLLISRAMWQSAREITGDQGARALLKRHPAQVETVAAPTREIAFDVDTEEQFRAAQAFLVHGHSHGRITG